MSKKNLNSHASATVIQVSHIKHHADHLQISTSKICDRRDSGTATYQKTCHKRVQQFLKKTPDRFKSKLVTMRSTSNYVKMTNKENEINNDKSKVSFLLVQVYLIFLDDKFK
ncbi:unnamed protein product [Rhizophagus irregularis]|nr:unnamed protein product [Rhizophagus irregularis]